jgi:hypothetical protein
VWSVQRSRQRDVAGEKKGERGKGKEEEEEEEDEGKGEE